MTCIIYLSAFLTQAIISKRKEGLINKRINTTTGPGYKWFYGFTSRHPELKFERAQRRLTKYRQGFTPETVSVYFDALRKVMLDHSFLDHPERIYNVDETWISRKDPVDKPKVIGVKGAQTTQVEVQ